MSRSLHLPRWPSPCVGMPVVDLALLCLFSPCESSPGVLAKLGARLLPGARPSYWQSLVPLPRIPSLSCFQPHPCCIPAGNTLWTAQPVGLHLSFGHPLEACMLDETASCWVCVPSPSPDCRSGLALFLLSLLPRGILRVDLISPQLFFFFTPCYFHCCHLVSSWFLLPQTHEMIPSSLLVLAFQVAHTPLPF